MSLYQYFVNCTFCSNWVVRVDGTNALSVRQAMGLYASHITEKHLQIVREKYRELTGKELP